jgi:hypothetical protein
MMQLASPTATALGTPAPSGGGFLSNEPATEAEIGDDRGRYTNPIQTVGDKTFILQDGVWTDTTFDPDNMVTQKFVFLSDGYFNLLNSLPQIGEYLALGDRVIFVIDDIAYEITAEEAQP